MILTSVETAIELYKEEYKTFIQEGEARFIYSFAQMRRNITNLRDRLPVACYPVLDNADANIRNAYFICKNLPREPTLDALRSFQTMKRNIFNYYEELASLN